MLTVKTLSDYGADVSSGLARCVNKESLYLKLVKKVPDSPEFEALRDSIGKNDLKAAFEHAHGLKGITANLSLDPILSPVSEITELLRSGTVTDYGPLLSKIESARSELKKLCGD